jgi:restriction system protein
MLKAGSLTEAKRRRIIMDCLGPQCASMVLDWLKTQAAAMAAGQSPTPGPSQGLLWNVAPYQEDAPAITSVWELSGAVEHLHYAVFRRYQNQLTRAERARLDNSIDNALFKIDRFLAQAPTGIPDRLGEEVAGLRASIREGREQVENRIRQARRADLKLAQLSSLTPESFEEFVGELFEMLGYDVEQVGGSGDSGADLRVSRRDGLLAVVQCKYHRQSVVGSPELQKFLGTIHHTRSHKGFFVTTSTFSLSAEKFAAENPIELLDGPRLVELIHDALGPGARRDQGPAWF